MIDRSVDSVARQAATGGALPGLLAFLGAPGVAALDRQFQAAGKKHGGAKKKRQRARKKCKPAVDRCGPQASTCTTLLTGLCDGNPDCLAKLVCCSELSVCNSAGFFTCLLA